MRLPLTAPYLFGDINGDGKYELYALGSQAEIGFGCQNNWAGCVTMLYGYQLDGTPVAGFPTSQGSTYGSSFISPSVADVNGDGRDDIIANTEKLIIGSDTGIRVVPLEFPTVTAPAVSDVDGDGKVEFGGVTWHMVWNNTTGLNQSDNHVALFKDTGSTYWSRQFVEDTWDNPRPLVLGDLDNDGKVELLHVHTDVFTGDLVAYLWSIPTTAGSAKYEWPLFNHDSARTGRRESNASAATTSPSSATTEQRVPTAAPTPTPSAGSGTFFNIGHF